MKQLLSILLLSAITTTAYADNNAKPTKNAQNLLLRIENLIPPAFG